MEQSQKTFATFSSSFSLSWSTSLLCTKKPLNQVNYEWNGIFWLHAQKLVSMEHIDTKNLGKYFWKSYKSMNLKLTHSLRKTQYLEFEERIRSLTSQGAKKTSIIELKSFMDRGIKNLTHIKRGGAAPFYQHQKGSYSIFVVYKFWLAVNVKYPLPLISQLCSRGQKRRQLSNWFSTFKLWTSWHCHTCESKEKLNSFLKTK